MEIVHTGLRTYSVLWSAAAYVAESLATQKLFEKARVARPWMAWIPVANLFPLMRTIRKSAWSLLWILVPLVDIAFVIYWQARLFRAFGRSGWLVCWNVLPFLGQAVYLAALLQTAFSQRFAYRLGDG